MTIAAVSVSMLVRLDGVNRRDFTTVVSDRTVSLRAHQSSWPERKKDVRTKHDQS
jgi:hypothetical protein